MPVLNTAPPTFIRFGKFIIISWIATLILTLDAPAQAASTPDFKFGSMVNPQDHSPARGVRPLLVILLQARPGQGVTPTLTHDNTYYERRLFGPGYPNVADYFKANSFFMTSTALRGGRGMNWHKAAIIGPFIDTTPPSTKTDPEAAKKENSNRRFSSIKGIAATHGFDFGHYDRNRDGTVSEAELGILVIDNFSHIGGVTSANPGCIDVARPAGGVISVCSAVSFIGEDTNIATFAHELSHQLGTIDLYGTNCLSKNLSLMSCTAANDLFLSFLDPWHRSRLGWLKPRLFRLDRVGTAYLSEPSNGYEDAYNNGPIILYDPSHGPREYFMLEYRARQRDKANQPYGYDADIPRNGVVVWHIKTDTDGNLLSIPDRIPDRLNHKCGEKNDQGIYHTSTAIMGKRLQENTIQQPTRLSGIGLSCGKVMSAVVISPGGQGRPNRWGGSLPWTPRSGPFFLKWLNNANTGYGQDTGMRFRIYDMNRKGARVRWDPR